MRRLGTSAGIGPAANDAPLADPDRPLEATTFRAAGFRQAWPGTSGCSGEGGAIAQLNEVEFWDWMGTIHVATDATRAPTPQVQDTQGTP